MSEMGRPAPKPGEVPIDFKSLMIQIKQKLNAEGLGRDRELHRETLNQFLKFREDNSSLHFGWRIFEGVSNHFWPNSVMPKDRPSTIQEHSWPFIITNGSLNICTATFEQLVDFIHCNSSGSFHGPEKTELQRRENRRKMRREYVIRTWRRRGYQIDDNISDQYVTSITGPPRLRHPLRRQLRRPVTLPIRNKTHPFTLIHPPMPPSSNTPHKIDRPSLLLPSGAYDIPNVPEASPCKAQLALTRVEPQAHTLQYKDTEMVGAPQAHVETITGGTVSFKKVPDIDKLEDRFSTCLDIGGA
ncbi:hypothetical protein F4803DRAFT_63738 [Xylaria telfairii]|nr:hypothetical protein F4803DRAFT_63738 [Xylaria telfairii]